MDLSQREHISPIKWENVLLYGQNLIGRSLIRRAWLATWGLSRNGVKNYSKGPCVTILE